MRYISLIVLCSLVAPGQAFVVPHHQASPLSTTVLGSSAEDDNGSQVSRRQALELGFAATGLGITFLGTRENDPTDYGLWGILPLGPYKSKKTVKETIVPDVLWTFDQKFGILDVQVPLRMTVFKMRDGGLFVYNPIAATPECVQFVRDLEALHGPVKHIVVGSVALEHKAYAGVFAQKFENAQVWLQPGQYSFPVNLPDFFLGFPAERTRAVPRTIQEAPADWQEELDVAMLGPIISRDGSFGETVILHKPTKTLLVTDTCVQATDEVPPIYDTDPGPLLFHARDSITDIVEDTPETRSRGYRRIVMFGLYFNPAAITIKDPQTALAERRPDINSDFAGIYPWDWDGDEAASWKGLTRIIPAHLKNNLQFTGKDYRASFGFLEEAGVPAGFPRPLAADLKVLTDAEIGLLDSGAIVKAPPKVGGSVSRAEIISQTTYRCRSEVCAPKAES